MNTLLAAIKARLKQAKWEWILIVLIIIGLGIESKYFTLRNKQLANQVTALTLENQRIDSIKNRRDQTIYTQNAIVTNLQDQVKNIAQEKFDLQNKYEKKVKDVEFFYQAKLKLKLPPNTVIVYKDTANKIPTDCEALKVFAMDSMIVVPKHIELDTTKYKDVQIDMDILKKGIRINAMAFTDSQFIRVDKMKRNVWQFLTFKPNKYQVKVLHTSPYMQVLGQNSIVYVPSKRANIGLKLVEAGALIFIGSRL